MQRELAEKKYVVGGGMQKEKERWNTEKQGKHNQSITKVKKIPRGSRENFGNALIGNALNFGNALNLCMQDYTYSSTTWNNIDYKISFDNIQE